MRPHFRPVLGSVIVVALLMFFILGLHVGGTALLAIGLYSPLIGSITGGTLVLLSINIRFRKDENVEPWRGREKFAWTLIGCGCIAWAIGECFWRYYVAHGESPFPSLADFGYSSFFPFVFFGLFLQPFTSGTGNKRMFLVLDSLIAMGALLSIAWFLLLGSLAQTPTESLLGKFLGLYYPTTDVALLSCTISLLLRGRDPVYLVKARRISLLLVVLGLTVYAISDFLFNVLQNMGQSVDGSYINLGWPFGIMMVGVAAYLRRFLPAGSSEAVTEQQERQDATPFRLRSAQAVPYLLLVLLFLVVSINIFSPDKTQQEIRPILIVATFIVISLVIVRQIVTMLENARLIREQAAINAQLQQVYRDIDKRKSDLEGGVAHIKDIQTRLANGDVLARAQIQSGDLWPLASGLNIMADRMMRSERNLKLAQKLPQAMLDLSRTLERIRDLSQFVLPASCQNGPPELNHLLRVLGLISPPETSPFHASPVEKKAEYNRGRDSLVGQSPFPAEPREQRHTAPFVKRDPQ
jgi:hypothetical protein